MPKSTYSYSAQNAAPASANYVLGIVEAGPQATLKMRRLTIWNPGMMTTAQMLTLSLVAQTTVGSGTTATPPPRDPGDPAFTGVVRVPGSTNGTAGTVLWQGQVWVPAAVAAAQPLVLDFTNGLSEKPPTVYPGIVAPVAATGTSNTNWYQIAALGTTTTLQWQNAGCAVPAVGAIFQATGAVAGGTGTVIPLVLATALSAGVTYSLAALGSTTTAQWQAVGAPAYVNVGTRFKASGAAVGTGLCVALGSGQGLYLRADNGAAGAASFSFTLEWTEE